MRQSRSLLKRIAAPPKWVQGAMEKPPGRLRRGETLCDAGKCKESLSLAFHKKSVFYGKSRPLHGAEGFQRAIGKPFGRLRRGETLCEAGKCKESLSLAFHKKFVFCGKSHPLHGAEGFQRAIGKPFGRLRRGETLCDAGKMQGKPFPRLPLRHAAKGGHGKTRNRPLLLNPGIPPAGLRRNPWRWPAGCRRKWSA